MPDLTLPQLIAKQDQTRRSDYKRYLDYYKGLQWPASARRATRRRRMVFNYAAAVVRKVASYVATPHAISITPPTRDEEPRRRADEAEAVIQAAYDDNAITRLDLETEVDTSVLGDGAFKVTWDATLARPVVSSPDVQGLWWWPDPADPRRPARVVQRYDLSAADVSATFAHVTTKALATVIEDWTKEKWDVWIDKDPLPSKPNPYGFIPYVVFPNLAAPKQQWGESDLVPIIEVTTELNRELSAMSAIMEVSGNPIVVMSGVTETQDIAVEPGSIWTMPDEAKAYILDMLGGGGGKAHIDYIDQLFRILHDLGEVPRAAFAGIDRDLSGVALEIEFRPLTQKVQRKQIVRHAAYIDRAMMILRLSDTFAGTSLAEAGSLSVIRTGDPIVPTDSLVDAPRETTLTQAELSSKHSAMSRLGADDPDAELQQIVVERQLLPDTVARKALADIAR